MAVKTKRIYQFGRLTNPAQQLSDGRFEVEVPLGPVAGAFVNRQVTFEELHGLMGGSSVPAPFIVGPGPTINGQQSLFVHGLPAGFPLSQLRITVVVGTGTNTSGGNTGNAGTSPGTGSTPTPTTTNVQASSYHIVADGVTDNAPAFQNLRAALLQQPTAHLVVTLPTGNGPILSSFNRLPLGVKYLKIDGQGGTLQTVTNSTDDIFQRLFADLETTENNGSAYIGTKLYTANDLLAAATAGSYTVQLLTPSAAGNTDKYRVGGRVKIFSEDTEGDSGYPMACENDEDINTITAIDLNTGTLTLANKLQYNHYLDQRDFPNTPGGHSGPPCIQSMDRQGSSEGEGYTYPDTIELANIVGLKPSSGVLGGLILATRKLILTNITTDHFFQPSQNDEVVVTDCDLLGGEMDKQIGYGTFLRVRFRGQITNGRWKTVTYTSCTWTTAGFGPAGRNISLDTCSLFAGVFQNQGHADDYSYPSLYAQPGHKPVDLLTLKKLTFSSSAQNTAAAHIDFAPFDSYTLAVADGTARIILPWGSSQDAAYTMWRTTRVGMAVHTASGNKGGRITKRHYDASYNNGQGAHLLELNMLTSGVPVANETWVWSSVRQVLDLGGHTITDTKKLMSGDMLRWKGNAATSGPLTTHLTAADLHTNAPLLEWNLMGFVDTVTVTVTTAGSGNLEVNAKPETNAVHLLVVDMSAVGTHTVACGGIWCQQLGQFTNGSIPADLTIAITWRNYEYGL